MRRTLMPLALLLVPTLAILGCKYGGTAGSMSGDMPPPFGGQEDMEHAADLWGRMVSYQGWASYPGLGGFQEGKSPHGKYLKYYINSTAASNPRRPGNGSIIIKENYGKKSDAALGAITVMEKIRDYDPENGDWFWVKFAPDGTVMKNPMGMSLAGRVAKGMNKGCIACHGNAGGGDYLFIND
ncbi:MAG: cytochrome P460 family protein [Planctomycetota bacterium]